MLWGHAQKLAVTLVVKMDVTMDVSWVSNLDANWVANPNLPSPGACLARQHREFSTAVDGRCGLCGRLLFLPLARARTSLLFKEISQEHAAPSHNRLLARHADEQI